MSFFQAASNLANSCCAFWRTLACAVKVVVADGEDDEAGDELRFAAVSFYFMKNSLSRS